MSALVSRIVDVAGSEGEGRVNEIAIDMVDLQPAAACVEGRSYSLWAVVGVPQLRGNEHVVALNLPSLEYLLHRIANRFLIAVPFGAVERSKARFQRGL